MIVRVECAAEGSVIGNPTYADASAWESMQRPTPRSVPANLSALHEQGVTTTRAVIPSAAANPSHQAS
jgi:hypothetical protein